MLAVNEQAKQGVQIHSISLRPLGCARGRRVRRRRAAPRPRHRDAARGDRAQKTGGNPFFMRQFLQALYAAKLIAFDCERRGVPLRRRPPCRTRRSRRTSPSFSPRSSSKLPRAHARGAARGGRRSAIASSSRCSRASTAVRWPTRPRTLRPAIDDGLIVPLSGLESVDPDALQSPLVYSRFAFLHDRVQQAAYATLAETEQPALHLAIGRAVLGGDRLRRTREPAVRHHQSLESRPRADRRRRRAATPCRAQHPRRHKGARLDRLRPRRALASARDRAARRERLARPLRLAMRRAPAAGGEPRSHRGLRRRVRGHRACARARRVAHRPRELCTDQDERAADHGPDSRGARVRPRGGSACSASICPTNPTRFGSCCRARSERFSSKRRPSASRTCSICPPMKDPATHSR